MGRVGGVPWAPAPHYLLRDREAVYGSQFRKRVRGLGMNVPGMNVPGMKVLGMKERPTAPRSPWRNPYAQRVIGSIRRACLDHVVVLDERPLKRLLRNYFGYYDQWRPHRSLAMVSPDGRPVHSPELGEVIAFPAVHGRHHYYLRQTA